MSKKKRSLECSVSDLAFIFWYGDIQGCEGNIQDKYDDWRKLENEMCPCCKPEHHLFTTCCYVEYYDAAKEMIKFFSSE